TDDMARFHGIAPLQQFDAFYVRVGVIEDVDAERKHPGLTYSRAVEHQLRELRGVIVDVALALLVATQLLQFARFATEVPYERIPPEQFFNQRDGQQVPVVVLADVRELMAQQ